MVESVGIVGASGYSGSVAARIVAAHPTLELAFVTSDQLAGMPAADRLGIRTDLVFSPNAEAARLGADVRAVLLCTPAEVSATLAPTLAAAGVLVVDLSGAFRLADAADYAKWYGFEHPSAEWLGRAHYGLPELFGPPPEGTTLVSNPGCYPTATLLALAPLVRAGLVEDRGIVVDAKSGTTGAGRQAKEEHAFAEVNEDLRAYKVLAHQHTPEIARYLGRARGGAPLPVTFVPHLLPVSRGLLATVYARPRPGANAARVRECLADAYRGASFVEVVEPGHVTLHAVAGTNRARVAATADDSVVVAIGAIDNLVKGAAGQAIQNVNLALGLPEDAGLAGLARFAP
jgi:N-acetyl-gamma-glutamyl-phosphate reductase